MFALSFNDALCFVEELNSIKIFMFYICFYPYFQYFCSIYSSCVLNCDIVAKVEMGVTGECYTVIYMYVRNTYDSGALVRSYARRARLTCDLRGILSKSITDACQLEFFREQEYLICVHKITKLNRKSFLPATEVAFRLQSSLFPLLSLHLLLYFNQ